MRLSAAEELAGLHVGTAECNGKILPDDVLPPSTPPTTTSSAPDRGAPATWSPAGVQRRCGVDVSTMDTNGLPRRSDVGVTCDIRAPAVT